MWRQLAGAITAFVLVGASISCACSKLKANEPPPTKTVASSASASSAVRPPASAASAAAVQRDAGQASEAGVVAAAPSADAGCVREGFQVENQSMELVGRLRSERYSPWPDTPEVGYVLDLDRPVPMCRKREDPLRSVQVFVGPSSGKQPAELLGPLAGKRVRVLGRPKDAGSGAGHFLKRYHAYAEQIEAAEH
ncbi:MAG: hypothetical protein H6716_00020 [Polyangiaceae bacterium]|nr:hypothetical protein [Polyangiaceae bacterium]